MPIVRVSGLSGQDLPTAQSSLLHVASAVSEAIPCPIDDVWCTFHSVDAMTVGDRAVEWDGRIVYVDVFMRSRGDDTAQRVLERCSAAAAEAFDVPLVDVWTHLVELAPGAVFAGGAVL